MKILEVGERTLYFAVVEDNGRQHEVPLAVEGYTILKQLLAPEQLGANIFETLQEELDIAAEAEPKPLQDMPDDLKRKLQAVGVEGDPGELYFAADSDQDEVGQV
jgi:hypothetical protein